MDRPAARRPAGRRCPLPAAAGPVDRGAGLPRRGDRRPPGRGSVRTAPRGRDRDRAGQRRQPRQFRRRLPGTAGHRDGAADLCRARAQLRRAQRGHDRPAGRRRPLRHHHGRRSAEPARGGDTALRPCPAWRLGRRLHALRREAACRLAQPGQPLRQLGGRRADGQAARPVSVVVPLHVGLRGEVGDRL